ncbi:hypothetical protein [Gloeocapsa sp. PCC 73106]|uniref:hypothetical protein n=1 Tax=Gloeocapsa sp. PCC 73106 TaxID=102232 RepID=UPI0002AD19A6|nr:hypothetical protein [Gloeocapsa sp. PCC 73106]ELR99455.1 hypothetical protein GLO73106DRAFT_00033060 [Gloeocapsa sp. PCC 73106]
MTQEEWDEGDDYPTNNDMPSSGEEDYSQFDRIGDPIADADCWQKQDGQNSCAVIAQIGIYESMTGDDISNQLTLGAQSPEQLQQEAIDIAQENVADYQRMAQYWRSQAQISQNLADSASSNYHEIEDRSNFEHRLEQTAHATGNEYTYNTRGIDDVASMADLTISMHAQSQANLCQLEAQKYEHMAAEEMSDINTYQLMDASEFTQGFVDNLESERNNIEQQIEAERKMIQQQS